MSGRKSVTVDHHFLFAIWFPFGLMALVALLVVLGTIRIVLINLIGILVGSALDFFSWIRRLPWPSFATAVRDRPVH